VHSSILMVLHDFLPEVIAGTEVHVARLASSLRGRHPVSLYYTRRAPGIPQLHLERASWADIPTFRLIQNYPLPPLKEEITAPGIEARFEEVLDLVRPEIVHFHHLLHHCLSLPRIARRRGMTTLFTLHDYHLACPAGGQLSAHPDGRTCQSPRPSRCAPCYARFQSRSGALERLALRASSIPGIPPDLPFRFFKSLPTGAKSVLKRLNARPRSRWKSPPTRAAASRWDAARALIHQIDLFIAPSQFLRRRFIDWGFPPEQIIHLPNCAPVAIRPSPLPRPPRPLRLIFIGTLAPHKGIDRLVDATLAFPPDAFQLEIIGDPDAFASYTHPLIHRSAGRIRFLGRLPHAEAHERLRRAHALVLTARWPENAPLTILEAQAIGRPVIAPRIGGIPEQIRHEVDGLLFDDEGGADLKATFARLVHEPRLVDRLAHGIRPPLSQEDYTEALMDIYAQAHHGRRPRHGASDGL